jgi:ABC-type multidrug transport system ATPase subunit
MLETFSPEESFRFAAKLRTGLSDEMVEEKVNDVISRLGLEECRNT